MKVITTIPPNAIGFIYNSKHSITDYYLYLLASPINVIPGSRNQSVVIPGRDGAYDFGTEIGERTIIFECALYADGETQIRQRTRNIAAWLDPTGGVKKLILDGEPDKFYWARTVNPIDVGPVLGEKGTTVEFVAFDPYAYANTAIVVEQSISDGETITLTNAGLKPTPMIVEIQNPELTGYKVFPALGCGICPDITITTLIAGFTLTVNDDECEYTATLVDGTTASIDTDRMTVKLGGVNMLTAHDGTFPMLEVGSNTLKLESTSGCSARVKITYYERWL